MSYQYRVRSVFETTPDDVEVLAPTETSTATLITCTGPWNAVTPSNTLLLIVVGDLIRDRSGEKLPWHVEFGYGKIDDATPGLVMNVLGE